MQNVQLNEVDTNKTEVYSVWVIPSEDVTVRLTEEEARDKFRKGCEGVKKVYSVNVEKVDVGTFIYQCVYLFIV
ncbi:hypothetical protein H5410_013687 [Solanum commersonii]|uniref:Uncharacterized protein n=1 Tax=Solanum commersonii TaxID=4109 RepID=A0A9J5ZP64_SOLCO|nr:hypothetical protein H5410_013687 [Solanum commersonii]